MVAYFGVNVQVAVFTDKRDACDGTIFKYDFIQLCQLQYIVETDLLKDFFNVRVLKGAAIGLGNHHVFNPAS